MFKYKGKPVKEQIFTYECFARTTSITGDKKMEVKNRKLSENNW